MVYVYSASGNKLRKLYTAGGITTTTEYDNGIQYDNSTTNVAFIQTEEGRARHSGTTYTYEYDLKDHLGNTRVTLTPDPNDPTQQTAKILQENDYYAFGYGIQSLQQSVPSPKNEYLYNHKELQEETGLYDYGARFYDPVIGRWLSVDPLAEKSRRFSPYVYGENDPVLNIDPDGMQAQGSGCCLTNPLLGSKYAKAAGKFIVNTIAFVTNFIDGENSHRAFSKDPAVRAEAQRELKGYAVAGAIMVMTDGLMSRIAGTFGTSVTSNSVWALDASERGFAVEQMLGGNLPYGFPVIDKFENGVATSIKSIDVTADSYTKGNGLFNTLKSYVNKLDGFQGAARGDFRISSSDISSKVLEVGIQPGKATLNQWEQIGNAMKYAKDNNIDFKLQFVK
ncbi:RHS repeat-associated core domain-containing protein [Mucilaginibacter sp. SJ]|uniref:RHS repeat-associated core domain-containing protein n=1 Tax=Mucilaginibacter sp. SJ TaxID=3029053 RepID=UPI0023A9ABAB|nr:RHS repeat-associated core domain-containing protein [Mucilaginibacter sp. SJ]WEA00360.1 hypothetical protein MusilaSJ_23165 [Mucilaginibacter sp. SJ]